MKNPYIRETNGIHLKKIVKARRLLNSIMPLLKIKLKMSTKRLILEFILIKTN